MSPLRNLFVTIGVAFLVLGSNLVFAYGPAHRDGGQVQKRTIPKEADRKVEAPAPVPAARDQPAPANVGDKLLELFRFGARPNPAAAAIVADPQQLQQYTNQCRPILGAELHRARKACEFTAEQRKLCADEGQQVVKTAAKSFAEMQQKMMMGQVRTAYTPADPRRLIQDGLSKAMKDHLSPEQWARYEQEVRKQAENRKEVAVRSMVAKLDQDLMLSAHQRARMIESLTSHWQDEWSQAVDMLLQGSQYFPSIPESLILPILDQTQKSVWNGTPRMQINFWGGFGFMGGVQQDGNAVVDEELGEMKLQARPDVEGIVR
jgi:hypothetical protein